MQPRKVATLACGGHTAPRLWNTRGGRGTQMLSRCARHVKNQHDASRKNSRQLSNDSTYKN